MAAADLFGRENLGFCWIVNPKGFVNPVIQRTSCGAGSLEVKPNREVN